MLDIGREMPLKEYLEEQEISIIKSTIKKFGSARKASAALKIDHSTITRKLKKYSKTPTKA
jgi:transcriptional regulator with PAS, ATPase and Fis domain